MSDLISRDWLLEQYDLKNCTKHGNETKEQQIHSYDTMMMYEIAGMIEDAPIAFDVDNVIEKINDARLPIPVGRRDEEHYYNIGFDFGLNKAIEIIKGFSAKESY